MRLFALSAIVFACLPAYPDIVTLTTGFVIEGHVVDAEVDPVYVEIPKGKIAVYKDMIESITIGEVVGEEEDEVEAAVETGDEETEAVPVPVINLRPELATDEDAVKYYTEVTAELERIVLSPEQAEVGSEALEPVYVEAIAGMGSKATPMLREGIKSSSPKMGAYLLDALSKASPADAREVAGDVLQTHEHPRAREKAVALVAQGEGADRDTLLEKATADPVWYVRSAAYRELSSGLNKEIPDTKALGKVAAGLADEDGDVQSSVREILKEQTGQDFEKPEDWQAWAERQTPIAATEVKPKAAE